MNGTGFKPSICVCFLEYNRLNYAFGFLTDYFHVMCKNGFSNGRAWLFNFCPWNISCYESHILRTEWSCGEVTPWAPTCRFQRPSSTGSPCPQPANIVCELPAHCSSGALCSLKCRLNLGQRRPGLDRHPISKASPQHEKGSGHWAAFYSYFSPRVTASSDSCCVPLAFGAVRLRSLSVEGAIFCVDCSFD